MVVLDCAASKRQDEDPVVPLSLYADEDAVSSRPSALMVMQSLHSPSALVRQLAGLRRGNQVYHDNVLTVHGGSLSASVSFTGTSADSEGQAE
jgi:hypothetical protein